MSIETEMDLVNNFISNMPKSNKEIVLREIPTDFGRPDILIVRFDEKVIKNSRSKNINIEFSKSMSYIMTYLYYRRWIKKTTLQQFLSCTGTKINSLIEGLMLFGLIEVKGKYIKSKPTSEILAIKRIWSYEAKLSQWQYAIEQAERHLWFTKESYVLLPKLSENILKKAIKECRYRNVGLAVFSENKSIDIYVKTSKKGIVNSPFIWKLNNQLIRGKFSGKT